ncbi:MAG: AAA family ATPase [Acidimicrobiia bacterium]
METDAERHPGSDTSPAVAETHLSTVFLVGGQAYKVLKPVAFEFVDLSTSQARRSACEREVALNRRIAPDIYLGVATYEPHDGGESEPVIVMKRMPAGRSLEHLVRSGADATECVRQVARTVAAFHADADRSAAVTDRARPDVVRRRWQENISELRRVGHVLGPTTLEELDAVDTLGQRYLSGRGPLLDRRISEGAVCDGHGDLLAADIYCLDDAPRILDCLAFRDDFRSVDVIADVAFLAMDLERLGRAGLARQLLDDYREFSGDTAPASLTEHALCDRALIRSKVAALRAIGGGTQGSPEAVALLAAAADHADRARVRMVLVGGLPGTGKTTLASGLADDTGFVLLRSDTIRRELARESGISYDDSSKDSVYDEMLRRAGTLLANGESVVLDASWTARRHRQEAEVVAEHTMTDVIALRTDLPREVAFERIEQRQAQGTDESQATPAVASELARVADPWPDAHVLDTLRSAAETQRGARALVGAIPGGWVDTRPEIS